MELEGTAADIDRERARLLSAILERVGYTLWQLAECEDTAAHFLMLKAHAVRGMGEKKGLELLEKAQKKTFGALLHDLRAKGIVSEDIAARLNSLVRERNWLVHDSKRENRGVINDLARVDALVERLTRIVDEAEALNKELGGQLEGFVIDCGVNPQTIEREARRVAETWGYEV